MSAKYRNKKISRFGANVAPRAIASVFHVGVLDNRFNYGCGYSDTTFKVTDFSQNAYMSNVDIAYRVASLYNDFIVKKVIIVIDEVTMSEYYALGTGDKETLLNLIPAPTNQAMYLRYALKDAADTGSASLSYSASTNFKDRRIKFNKNNRIKLTYYPKCKKYVTCSNDNLIGKLQNQLILMGCVKSRPGIYIGWGPMQVLPGSTDGTRAVQKVISGRMRTYVQYQFARRKNTSAS